MNREQLRNIAIIAHVDHGKTTLVDAMLRQSNVFHEKQVVRERVLDSHDLERERGITILAKNTAVRRGEHKINIVDTPGHADFGGEVERVLNMVDGVLLLVDAVEGPMPQTRFVLRKALGLGHKAVVVVNKIDRPHADPKRVIDEVFDLFIDLGADERQADFEVVYTNALEGMAGTMPEVDEGLGELFDAILRLPCPAVASDGPTQMMVSNLSYDDYKGRIALGRLERGAIEPGQQVMIAHPDRTARTGTVAEVFVFEDLGRTAVPRAEAGEIVAVTGLDHVGIGETITDPEAVDALPPIVVEKPTVRMSFIVNDSPFAGMEGSHVTSRALAERLDRELERNVALRVDRTESADTFLVSGRGELHLAILIEEMRREGYEFAVGRPEVIIEEIDGVPHEPHEDVYIDVGDDHVGAVVELLGRRRGQMLEMRADAEGGTTSMKWRIPTRGLLGFRTRFLSATAGTGVMHTLFHGYLPHAGTIEARENGALVAYEMGTTTSYALDMAQQRGELFVGPGVNVYAGQIVGRRPRSDDLDINVCKKKHVTNHRKSFAEEGIALTPPVPVTLDMAIEYISDDELVEVTPQSIRLRKRELDKERRIKAAKRARAEAPVSA